MQSVQPCYSYKVLQQNDMGCTQTVLLIYFANPRVIYISLVFSLETYCSRGSQALRIISQLFFELSRKKGGLNSSSVKDQQQLKTPIAYQKPPFKRMTTQKYKFCITAKVSKTVGFFFELILNAFLHLILIKLTAFYI